MAHRTGQRTDAGTLRAGPRRCGSVMAGTVMLATARAGRSGTRKNLDPDVRHWLAFAKQKLGELHVLADALDGKPTAETALAQARQALETRRQSPKVHRPEVAQRLAALRPETTRRNTAYPQRRQAQQHALNLPAYPTTTIGSFPQTLEVREARAQFKSGKLSKPTMRCF